jgi:hypothetical protein
MSTTAHFQKERSNPVLPRFPSEKGCGNYSGRHEEPTDEMVHISALFRWKQQISVGPRRRAYEPKNLLSMIGNVANADQSILPVVDWDGTPLDPRNPNVIERIAREFGSRA